MSKNDKLIKRFLSEPKDFTWSELVKILSMCGYEEVKTGKTGGPRTAFKNQEGTRIKTHKPHPGNIFKNYVIKEVKNKLNLED